MISIKAGKYYMLEHAMDKNPYDYDYGHYIIQVEEVISKNSIRGKVIKTINGKEMDYFSLWYIDWCWNIIELSNETIIDKVIPELI